MTGHDSPKILALLENQIQDLKAQLEKADAQLEIATAEKSKLLDLLSAEKEEKCALMPPPEEKNQESKGKPAAPTDRCAIAPSNQKSDLPNFYPKVYLYTGIRV